MVISKFYENRSITSGEQTLQRPEFKPKHFVTRKSELKFFRGVGVCLNKTRYQFTPVKVVIESYWRKPSDNVLPVGAEAC